LEIYLPKNISILIGIGGGGKTRVRGKTNYWFRHFGQKLKMSFDEIANSPDHRVVEAVCLVTGRKKLAK
jgi:hypothetical protein